MTPYALVCVLCGSAPALAVPASPDSAGAAPQHLALATPLPASTDSPSKALAVRHDGDHGGGHGGTHVAPMWIAMGVMMVAMLAVVGVYMMRGGAEARLAPPGAMPSPADLAVPVGVARPGTG